MKNNIDLTKLLDGTEYGRLKVRVFAFLNERYQEIDRSSIPDIEKEVYRVFQNDEAVRMVEQWYKAAFE